MLQKFNYFDVDHAIAEHDRILQKTGGRPGILNLGLVESPIEFIQNDDYYPELTDKLTHLVFSFAKNHGFNDGNKRSSIVLGSFFLQINGYGGLVDRFIIEMENVVLCTAADVISKDGLWQINADLIENGELGEESKLMLIAAMEEYARLEAERLSEEQSPQ